MKNLEAPSHHTSSSDVNHSFMFPYSIVPCMFDHFSTLCMEELSILCNLNFILLLYFFFVLKIAKCNTSILLTFISFSVDNLSSKAITNEFSANKIKVGQTSWNFLDGVHSAFSFSKSTMKTAKQCVNYVQS